MGGVFFVFFFISPVISAMINSVVPEFQFIFVIGYEFVLIALTSLMVYRLFPACEVSWRAAGIGAGISGVAITLTKYLYVVKKIKDNLNTSASLNFYYSFIEST